MNLRELVATLECEGKPQYSEASVNVLAEDGTVYTVKRVEFEDQAFDKEGNWLSVGGSTVWLMVEEC